MEYILRMTGRQHDMVRRHLYPGDGLEAVAVAVCGRRSGDSLHAMSVHEILLVPHAECVRRPDMLHWKTDRLVPLLERVAAEDLALVKVHSHPGGFPEFSDTDTRSDLGLFASVFGWSPSSAPHASAVMLPDGSMFGRVFVESARFVPLDLVAVAGDDLKYWHRRSAGRAVEEARSHEQVFGAGTTDRLRCLRIAVVGCSGTGSHVIEMLARLGVRLLVLVDPERVERRNLNRVVNSAAKHASDGELKVDVMREAVERMGLGTDVTTFPCTLLDPDAVRAVADCDVVFGCVDSAEGRHVLSRLAVQYALPYFDLGVRIDADGSGGVDVAAGTVHYVQPDGWSLLTRGVYTMAQVEAEVLRRANPAEFEARRRAKYIVGVQEERPAVVSINGLVASVAVNDFLARLHPHRRRANCATHAVRIDLLEPEMFGEAPPARTPPRPSQLGRGDVEPLLGLVGLGSSRVGATAVAR